MTTSSTLGGSGTRSKCSERVSRNSAAPAVPRLTTIWSMMPVGAPTNSFSAHFPAIASSTSSRRRSKAARRARQTLTSSAALEDSPLPIGTVDSMRMSAPRRWNPRFRSATVTPCT